MRRGPNGERHEQRMAGHPNNAGTLWIETLVPRSTERKRIWPTDGQGHDQAHRQHNGQSYIHLPRRPVPNGHKWRAARSTDQPD